MLQVLAHHRLVHLQPQPLVGADEGGEVLPAAGGDELGAVHVRHHLVKVVGPQLQIGKNGRVNSVGTGIFLPDGQVSLHVHALDPVQRDDVELPHALVVLGRVARGGDDPALGHFLVAEGFALQKLQHGGGQRLGDTVDLVDEQNALRKAGVLHALVHAGDDLAHGVLGDGHGFAAVLPLLDHGQAHGALAGVVGDGIGHQGHPLLPGNLLHDLGFSDAWRAHQQNGPLANGGNGILAVLVPAEIGPDRVGDLLFGTLDVQGSQLLLWQGQRPRVGGPVSNRWEKDDQRLAEPAFGRNSRSSSTSFMAQGGRSASSYWLPRNRNAAS